MTAIQTRHLCRTFQTRIKPEGFLPSLRSLFRPQHRAVEAVQDISFAVEAGESIAFLGPNGAGKSTTIKMLCGILRASSGSIDVLGFDPSRQRQALAFNIGSVFGQKSQLWYHLPAGDSFRLLGAVYEIEPKQLRIRTDELVERFGLKDFWDMPVRKLSLGQRIRCEIAASLLHKPRLLFLTRLKENEASLADWGELESLAWRCLGLQAFFVHDTSPGEGSSRPPVCMNALLGDGFKFYVRGGFPQMTCRRVC